MFCGAGVEDAMWARGRIERGLEEKVSKKGKPGKPVLPGPADYN